MSQENVEIVQRAFEIFNRYGETDLSWDEREKAFEPSPSSQPRTSSTSSLPNGRVPECTGASTNTAMSWRGSSRPSAR